MSDAVVDPDAPLTGAAVHIDRHGLKAVVWVCFAVPTVFVFLRLGVRWRQNRIFLPDDYWIIFSWACLLTMAVLQTVQMDALWYTTYLSAGRIAPTEEAGRYAEELVRWQFPIIKLFWTVLWSVKASFLAVFYRLVRPFPILRRIWYAVAAFAALAYIGCWISSTLTCDPPSKYFEAGGCDSPGEQARSRFNVIYSTTVDIVSDLMIMALPIAVLPSLQLDVRKKIGLGVAFSLGIIIICVAIVRMTQVVVGDQIDLIGLATWGAVETATAVVVGSLPPLKALLSRGVRKYSSNAKSSQRYGATAGAKNGCSNTLDGYAPGSKTRSTMVAESIPLDDVHTSAQVDGRIYVRKTYETHVESHSISRGGSRDGSRDDSRDDDEAAMVVGRAK